MPEGDESALKFALANAQKDLRYYTHMAEAAPTTAFLAEAAHQLCVLAKQRRPRQRLRAEADRRGVPR